MPSFYRSMIEEGGRPVIGRSATALGVRVPPSQPTDITPDAAGNVHPGSGGMSVVSGWRHLKPWRIPLHLRPVFPAAAGRSVGLRCWRMGTGTFGLAGPAAPGLAFAPDPRDPNHATLEPDRVMALADYEAALAATAPQWVIDEA
jgi:hypothetical protein